MAASIILTAALCVVGILQQGIKHTLRRSDNLVMLWEEHLRFEFDPDFKSVEATMDTMSENPYVNHVPTLVGGAGVKSLQEFYRSSFIYSNPAIDMQLISRTVGRDRLVDEMILDLNHTAYIDWLVPGIAPSGRRVRFPLVVIVDFSTEEGEIKISSEHIYWDQATVLLQLGAFDTTDLWAGANLDISGVEQAMKVEDPSSVEPNAMLSRALESRKASSMSER